MDAGLGIASSIILVVLMLLTVVDVTSRYLFNWPLRGAFELTELMLLVLIFAGLPLVSRADEHVTMDFVDRLLAPTWRAAVIRVVHAITVAVMFLLAWLIWSKAGAIGAYGDSTGVLRIQLAPFVYFMAIMIAVTGLIHVWKIFVPGDRRASAERASQAAT